MQKARPWCIAILVAFFAVIYRFYQTAPSSDTLAMMSTSSWHFAAQRGFFTHDDDPASWEFRATTQPSLGLRERPYPTDDDFWAAKGTAPAELSETKWPRFQHYIKHLNSQKPKSEHYKILFVVRHGQGLHNVKETEVGRDEWNRHWAKLPGDGNTTWLDAALTPLGEQQAAEISTVWTRDSLPPPQSIYSSPLRRCLQTTQLAFAPLIGETVPVIKERLRERLGVHTCDQRSSKTWIASAFPGFRLEDGFVEDDELWQPDRRETIEEHIDRKTALLIDLFENDENQAIALVAHSGAMMALFGATGWGKVPVKAGAVYPLLVRATKTMVGE